MTPDTYAPLRVWATASDDLPRVERQDAESRSIGEICRETSRLVSSATSLVAAFDRNFTRVQSMQPRVFSI